MVIRDLLKKADKILSEKGIEDSFNEAAVLFTYAGNTSKTYLFTHMDDEVSGGTEKLFYNFIARRAVHEPVAYIVGTAWFMSLKLFVNESTLIPRPETEGLAEEALAVVKNIPSEAVKLLDICTGSGCVGLVVAHFDNRVDAILSDLNPTCVDIAKKNVQSHNLKNRVKVIESDLYKAVPKIKFDIITANPPYIPTADIDSLDDDVRLYEPMAALDGGIDGLDFYRKIISGAREHLKPGGYLLLELGIGQSHAVRNILETNGFTNISIKNDIAGIPRILTSMYS